MPFQINKSFVLCGDQTEYLRRKQIPACLCLILETLVHNIYVVSDQF